MAWLIDLLLALLWIGGSIGLVSKTLGHGSDFHLNIRIRLVFSFHLRFG